MEAEKSSPYIKVGIVARTTHKANRFLKFALINFNGVYTEYTYNIYVVCCLVFRGFFYVKFCLQAVKLHRIWEENQDM